MESIFVLWKIFLLRCNRSTDERVASVFWISRMQRDVSYVKNSLSHAADTSATSVSKLSVQNWYDFNIIKTKQKKLWAYAECSTYREIFRFWRAVSRILASECNFKKNFHQRMQNFTNQK